MINYFRKKLRLLYTLVDLAFIVLAYVVGNLIVKEEMAVDVHKYIINAILVTSAIYVLLVIITGVYKNILKYVGFRDLAMVASTCVISFLATMVVSFFLDYRLLEMNVILVSCFCAVIFMLAYRTAARFIYVEKKGKVSAGKPIKNILIIGAGQATVFVLDDIELKHKNYNVCALVDDDVTRLGGRIRGVEVLGNRNDIVYLCEKLSIDEIFFCIAAIPSSEKAKILKICTQTGCRVRMLPGIAELEKEKGIAGNIKNVSIEDLLERDEINLDISGIEAYIKDKTVLVTGGGGSIGSELCRQIVKFSPQKLIILDIYENNAYSLEQELKTNYPGLDMEVLIASVRDKKRIDLIFETKKPDIVFHAAAHKHVPLMETSPSEAVKNNVFGTYNLVTGAHKYNVKKFVFISTDKAVNPTNIMGATKRICEMIIQSASEISKTEFVAVRFGNVLGSNGSVVPLFKKQIEAGGPVTLTHKEITRFFMTIPEAAKLVLQAGAFAAGGEIFVLDMGQPVKIYDLAVNLITLSGLTPGVDIPIKITGLRPGEKLYEELLMSEEGLTNTKHGKIFTARPMHFEWSELNEKLDRLKSCIEEYDDEKIREEIRSIVPTFRRDDRDKECEGLGENIEVSLA